MSTPAVLPLHTARADGPPHRAPLSPLAAATVASMGVMVAVLAGVQLLMFGFQPQLAVSAAVFAACTAFTLLGWRWAPAGGALFAALQLLLQGPYLLFVVTTLPAREFAPLVVLVACSVATLATGIAATVQNYRRAAFDRRAPRWLAPAMAAIAGCCAGALALGMAPRMARGVSIAPETMRALPSITARQMRFETMEIRARAGETVALRLENRDGTPHLFEIDELGVHMAMPAHGTAVTIFRTPRPGRYRFYCGPHFDRASGRGMYGTLVVSPAREAEVADARDLASFVSQAAPAPQPPARPTWVHVSIHRYARIEA